MSHLWIRGTAQALLVPEALRLVQALVGYEVREVRPSLPKVEFGISKIDEQHGVLSRWSLRVRHDVLREIQFLKMKRSPSFGLYILLVSHIYLRQVSS
ncbi:hypothetical protein QBC44DRAFT_4005 [Cladorrhinum sp. PSN332]|nr:hypothetical protein QBC44DRAFT_4005 [Cladorrhinum sp. PSN332]